MKSAKLIFAASVLSAVLVLPVPLAAQHTRYKLIDIGTFGGPQSFSFFGQARSLNNGGTLVGFADTSTPDPNYPNSNPLVGADPFIEHGVSWRKGTLTDLGALPGINSSNVSWVNDQGVPAGVSTTGNVDPLLGFPAANAVVWVKGHIFNLGTLDGGYESLATAINNRGQIAGFASNSTPDPISLFGPRQLRRLLHCPKLAEQSRSGSRCFEPVWRYNCSPLFMDEGRGHEGFGHTWRHLRVCELGQ